MAVTGPERTGLLGRLGSMIAWSMVGQGVYILSQFAILVLLARFSSVEDVGRFGLSTAITAPVFFFFQFGLRFNQATDAASEFGFSSFLLLRFVSTILSLASIAAIGLLATGDTRTLSILALFSLAKAVEMHSDLMYGVFQKNDALRMVAESLIARGVFSTIAFALLLIFGGSPVWAFLGYFVVWLAVFLAFDFPRARRMERANERRASLGEIARLAWNSAPLGLAGLFANLSSSIPRFVLAYFAGLEQLGIYTGIAYVYQGANMVVQSVNQAIIGRLAKNWRDGNTRAFHGTMLKLTLILSGLAFVAMLAILPVGNALLDLAFGAAFEPYGTLLVLMVAALALNIPMTIHQTGLMAQRRFPAQLANRAIFALSVGVFSSAGIALYGLNGAAIGLAVASVLQLPVVLVLLRRAEPGPGARAPDE